MKRLFIYIVALLLLPQVTLGTVLVGKTEGTFSVSPSGAATYTIPIKVQNGLSEFSPSISLTYNSQSGNGIAGMGFSISGLSTISIVPRSVYFDGQAEAIYTNEDNAFALDGQRLLLKSGSNGHTGAIYRTENEKYSIISITNSSNATPATFQVKTTDGATYKYGNSSGRLTLSNGEAYQWALDYAEDALGNYIQYTYAQEGVLYPTSITYGRNTHGTAGVDCSIIFNYENRTDSVPTYLFGEQRYLKKRLKSIACKYDGNIYRTYTLNYTEAIFSHLISVTETGTGTSTVPPTTFEWEVPSEFMLDCKSRYMDMHDRRDSDIVRFFSTDLDGDGNSEIVSVENISRFHPDSITSLFYVRKYNPSTQTFDYTDLYDVKSSRVDVLNGSFSIRASHKTGNSLVLPYCRRFPNFVGSVPNEMHFAFPEEGNWEVTVRMVGHSTDNEKHPIYTFLDSDRDGIDNIFIIEKEDVGNGIYPANLVTFDMSENSQVAPRLYLNLNGVPDKIRSADFNSDGMPDLLITTSNGYYIYWNRNGSFSDSDRYPSSAPNTSFKKCDIIELGDFDGDGLVDLLLNKHDSNQWYIARNTGNDTNGYFDLNMISELNARNVRVIEDKEDKTYCLVQDIDGDGKSDAIVGYPYTNDDGGHILILKSNGYALTLSSYYPMSNSDAFPNRNHIIQGFYNGQGGVQILYKGKNLSQNTTGWYILENPTVKPSSQKMISVTDGLGATDSISYGLLTDTDVYHIDNNSILPKPVIHMAGAIPVMKTRTEFIPTDIRTTDYSYANGLVHLQGKGFLGFQDIKTISSTGVVTETHSVLDSTYHVLLPRTVTQRNTAGDIICQDVNSTVLLGAGLHSYTIGETSRRTDNFFDGFFERESSSSFQYGFPAIQMKADSLFHNEQNITYWNSPNNNVWLKGFPSMVEITKYGERQDNWVVGDDVYEKTIYERATSTGLILKETRRRNGQIVSTDGYTYNEYGQVTQHYTVPYNSTDTLVTTFEYYPNGKLKKEYDPKGLYRQYTYNSTYGTLTSVRDFDGVTTQYTYDGMLRETKRQNAIETLQTTRALSSYGGGKYSIKETKTGETPVTTYYDAWERKIAESAPLANGTAMYTDYHYLSNGKVGFVSFPHRSYQSTTEGTTYTYDFVHRLDSIKYSDGKTSTWSYSPMQVESCIDGITTTTNYYTKGIISDVEDDAGWVHYDYNADGNICFIYGNVGDAIYEYDTYGRLTRTTDMNGVTKQYSFDRNGYPDSTNIAGNYVKTNYDKFGILRSKSWADSGESPHTVSYTYDNKFQLIGETGNGYQNTYSYDTYGRMTHKTKRVNDTQAEIWNVSYQYSGSRVRKMDSYFNSHSPTTVISEAFSYQNGYNVSDTLNHSLVWSLVKQDKWGHVTEEFDSLGTTTHSYDDYGNMLSMRRIAGSPINESYTYNIQTGNMSSKNGTTLSYDSMNRLTAWGNQSYTYDSKGNITTQPNVGNFSYNGFRVTDMSAENDYVIDDSLRISYYKAIERPRSIENEHYRADFFYDGDGDRYMMKVYERHAEGDSLIFTRYYMDANAEVTKDTLGHYTHLYYAGGDAYTAPAVMVIDETGQTATYQITRDNLGSAIQYASKNGVRYRYSYSPWGVRTHQVGGNTVFYQPGEDSLLGPFYRTYTGHEDLWMFGLINANARLYSPYLGRFISPDPLLNSEGGPLGYNPYVYANNNPFKYIDRNGEFVWFIPVIFGGFAAAAVTSYYSEDVLKSMVSFVCGAVATGLSIGVGVVVGGAVTAGVGAIGVSVGSPVIVAAAPFIGAGVGAAAGYVSYNLTYSGLTGTPFNFSWTDLGIEVGIAVATVGAGKIVSKLASKGSKIMQTRHRPLETEPDAMPAISNAGKVNSAPINYENSAIQFSAYQKGEMGKLQRMDEIIQNGGTILGTEVTIEVNGIRIRPDIVYRNKEGLLIFSEVKNGPRARLTHNQGRALPIMSDKHPVIFPKGGNAAKIPEFKNVMINNAPYTGNYGVEIIHYDPPILH